jgi:hypothetical protein
MCKSARVHACACVLVCVRTPTKVPMVVAWSGVGGLAARAPAVTEGSGGARGGSGGDTDGAGAGAAGAGAGAAGAGAGAGAGGVVT